jgi:hypothetical protein
MTLVPNVSGRSVGTLGWVVTTEWGFDDTSGSQRDDCRCPKRARVEAVLRSIADGPSRLLLG